jgi:hypothetical protein
VRVSRSGRGDKRYPRARKRADRGAVSARITRVYVYKWFGEPPGARLDAGLVDPGGRPRQAYWVVRRFARWR